MTTRPAQLLAFLTLLGVLALTVAAYLPGLPGTLQLDDKSNLSPMNAHGQVDDMRSFRAFVFGNHSGRSGRPVAMASFLVDDNAWPTQPGQFKRTNLKLHLICTLLVAWLAWLLAQRLDMTSGRAIGLTLLLGALWGLHPLNDTTVLYIVQRMTQLSCAFVLIGLIAFLKLDRTDYRKSASLVPCTAAFGLALLLGVLSKENAIVLPLLALIAAACLPAEYTAPASQRARRAWLTVFCGLPLAGFAAWCAASWQSIMRGYLARDFDLYERLLTQARILVDYMQQILLHRVSGTGLTHDDVAVSTGLTEPMTTILAIAVIAASLAFAWLVRRTIPLTALGIFWFFAAHIIESTFIPLELYFEHRNYLPMVGLLLAFVGILLWAIERVTSPIVRATIACVPAVFLALHVAMLIQSTRILNNPHLFIQVWEAEHPGSPRAKRLLAEYFAQRDDPVTGIKLYREALAQHPRDLSMMAGAMAMACRTHQPMPYSVTEFVERAQQAKLTGGLLPIMEKLTEDIVSGRCSDLGRENLHRMLDAAHGIEQMEYRPKIAAKLHYLHADVYEDERHLSPAMKHLEAAFEYQASVDVAVRQVILLASAGLHDIALERLKTAYQAHESRFILRPSRLAELNAIGQYLVAEQEKQQQTN